MNLKVANLNTQMGGRIGSNSGDAGTGIYNSVSVTDYAPGMPSNGYVSAYIKGSVMEGGQRFEFFDFTSVFGEISTFSKFMSYGSQPS